MSTVPDPPPLLAETADLTDASAAAASPNNATNRDEHANDQNVSSILTKRPRPEDEEDALGMVAEADALVPAAPRCPKRLRIESRPGDKDGDAEDDVVQNEQSSKSDNDDSPLPTTTHGNIADSPHHSQQPSPSPSRSLPPPPPAIVAGKSRSKPGASVGTLAELSVARSWPLLLMPLIPLDRMLFVWGSRLYEGEVVVVSMAAIKVKVLFWQDPDMKKPKVRSWRISNRHDNNEYQLVFLFRMAANISNPRMGEFVAFKCLDLWLELDDVFELSVQGGRCVLDPRTNTFRTPSWIGRVIAIQAYEALIRCWPHNTNPPDPNDEKATPRAPVPTKADPNPPHATEWVPRNTLRFVRFIRRAKPPKPPQLTFQAAVVPHHSH
jgi:hypothetical protein